MKAKIIKTGEIVEVYHEPQHGQVSNIYKESVLVNGRVWQENEIEFIESKEVDFERELSKYVSNGIHRFFPNVDDDYCKMESFIWQDYVIETAKYFFELGLKAKGE